MSGLTARADRELLAYLDSFVAIMGSEGIEWVPPEQVPPEQEENSNDNKSG